ncbi:MAG: Tad domain-containing protein, partial [Cyanobacteria bacterium]|nr:Tad domain-containing protein [Cyanobacteriota bacterium]
MFNRPYLSSLKSFSTRCFGTGKSSLHLSPSRSGSSLVFTIAFIVVLLGFLGLAIYTGLNSFTQSELQNAASTSALVGASSMYDGTVTDPNNLVPIKDAGRAKAAAQAVFDRIKSNSPILNRFTATLDPDPGTGITTRDSDDSVQVNAKASIPTPFLSLIGVDTFQVTASARARYVKAVFGDSTNAAVLLP